MNTREEDVRGQGTTGDGVQDEVVYDDRCPIKNKIVSTVKASNEPCITEKKKVPIDSSGSGPSETESNFLNRRKVRIQRTQGHKAQTDPTKEKEYTHDLTPVCLYPLK